MTEFAYVNGYQLGERVDIARAEELLASYNDFYSANLEFYRGQLKPSEIDDEPDSGADQEAATSRAEERAEADVKAFEETWGSLDFANATLSGLEIDWDAIQEIVFREQEKNIRPGESELIPVGHQLRRVSSVLAYAERLVGRLQRKAVDKEVLQVVRDGCDLLLQQIKEHDIDIPELDGAENRQINKIKTVDGLLEYANRLFACGR